MSSCGPTWLADELKLISEREKIEFVEGRNSACHKEGRSCLEGGMHEDDH
jgi:hypothetical protein